MSIRKQLPLVLLCGVSLLLSGCAAGAVSSANETSCKLLMTATNYFNQVVKADNANRTDQTLSDLNTMLIQFPAQVQTALDKATGDVAVKLQTLQSNATRVSLNVYDEAASADLSASFQPAYDACIADGVEMTAPGK